MITLTNLLKYKYPVVKQQQRVYIDCEATPSCGQWVLHEYHGRGELDSIQRLRTADVYREFYPVLYRCCCCGHIKQFGLEGDTETAERENNYA